MNFNQTEFEDFSLSINDMNLTDNEFILMDEETISQDFDDIDFDGTKNYENESDDDCDILFE